MKYRQGFVTNSSSSSFVVAKKKTSSINDIMDILNKQRTQVQKFVEDIDLRYITVPQVLRDAIDSGDIKQATNLMIAYMATQICQLNIDMTIDDWNIACFECSNESNEAFINYCYSYLVKVDESIFKIAESYS